MLLSRLLQLLSLFVRLLVNQTILSLQPHPIPAIGKQFERIIADCVGALSRTKSGNQYLLTIMCAHHFPEAVPLRKISSVMKALTCIRSSPCNPN